MNLTEKLVEVQSRMKAPKNLRNNFGGYNYRNAEQIFEAFKPYGNELKLVLTVSDDLVQVGSAVYIKAVATITDAEKPSDMITVTAYAKEPDNKKGMDSAQITGASSSYARKYALNGLFLLDDTKDPDSEEYARENKGRAEQQKKAAAAEDNSIKSKIVLEMKRKGYAVSKKALEQLDSMDQKALEAYYQSLIRMPDKAKKEEETTA